MFYPDWNKSYENTGLNFGKTFWNVNNPFESTVPETVAAAETKDLYIVAKSVPCKYCKDGFDFFNRVVSPSCRTSGTTSGVFIREKENGTFLVLSSQSYLHGEHEENEIHYCPWCGRKL